MSNEWAKQVRTSVRASPLATRAAAFEIARGRPGASDEQGVSSKGHSAPKSESTQPRYVPGGRRRFESQAQRTFDDFVEAVVLGSRWMQALGLATAGMT